jgi:threonine/homoserine/homoserine lactone efflux protein
VVVVTSSRFVFAFEQHKMSDVSYWLLGWVILSLWLFGINFLRAHAVARTGSALTTRMRQRLFSTFVGHELVCLGLWFLFQILNF